MVVGNIKKLLKHILSLYVLLILCTSIIAQQKGIDSLKVVLEQSANDTNKVIVLNTLSDKLYNSTPFLALKYSQTALKLSQELDYKRGIAKSYNNIGIVYYCQGKYSEALDSYLKAIKIYDEMLDKHGLLKTYNNIGVTFFDQKNYDKAEEYYLASLKIKQELGDVTGIANSYNNLGVIYRNRDNFDQALSYYNKSLALMEELKNKEGIAKSLNNIGMIYILKKEYTKALDNLNQALDIKKEVNDRRGIANTLNNIADVFYNMKQYAKAIETLNKSIKLSKELGAKDITKSAYEKLSAIYAASGNFKEAFSYHTLYSSIKDTLLNEAQSKQVSELAAQYEDEKQDLKIESLTKDNELKDLRDKKNRLIILGISVGLVLVLILAFIAFRAYKEKQHANQLLSVQNDKISHQKLLIEEKNKDIMDSIQYAKRIQEAIYPSKKLVKNYLEESFVLFKPKDVISGDFYWMSIMENKTFFAAVDCTGHGVPGALMSIVGYNGLNQAVNEYKLSKPSEILNHLNNTVNYTLNKDRKEGVIIKDGMDIALCAFDKEKMVLEYAGAYNPLYIVRNNQIIEIKADRHPIGAFGDGVDLKLKPFTNNEVPIEHGDIMYVFSDGFADQFGGEQGKKFTYKRLKETLISVNSHSMEEQRHTLHVLFEQWKGELEQVDDVCIVGVKFI